MLSVNQRIGASAPAVRVGRAGGFAAAECAPGLMHQVTGTPDRHAFESLARAHDVEKCTLGRGYSVQLGTTVFRGRGASWAVIFHASLAKRLSGLDPRMTGLRHNSLREFTSEMVGFSMPPRPTGRAIACLSPERPQGRTARRMAKSANRHLSSPRAYAEGRRRSYSRRSARSWGSR